MLREYLKSLADKFRSLLGMADDELINAQDFPEAIDDVYEAGKQAQYDEFWDDFQQNGNRQYYNFGFASHFGWNEKNLKPKYDVKPLEANYIFYAYRQSSLKPCFYDRGISIDFSGCRNMANAFLASALVEIGVVDLTSASASTGGLFMNCSKLVTIEKLVMASTTIMQSTSFNGCTLLENIEIEGVISNAFFISQCTKLTHDSLMSIINALETKTSGTFTLTIGTTNLAKLTDEEKAVATEKGWTLV